MKRLAVGKAHTLVVSDKEELWGCGDNNRGQLGLFSIPNVFRPNMKRFKKNSAVSVCAGHHHTILIDNQDKAWACGDNSSGQLGIEKSTQRRYTPHIVPNLPPVKAVASHIYHSLFLDQEGFVWSCGRNQYGQSGLGDCESRSKLEKITNLPPIQAVGCGQRFSIFLDTQGNVWGAGDNHTKCIGNESTSTPKMIEGIPKIKSISVGEFHNGFITEENQLMLFGYNEEKQLGPNCQRRFLDATTENRIDLPPINKICCYSGGSMILADDGSLWNFGNTSFGQMSKSESRITKEIYDGTLLK